MTDISIGSLDELRGEVENAQDVLTVSMVTLRDAHGAGRLGIHVRSNISKALRSLGLGHYPEVLPDSQWEPIRIFKLGSPTADLIDAVLNPTDEHDAAIREAAGGEAADTLTRVRELICA